MTTLAQAAAAAVSRHSQQAFGLMGNGNAHFIDALTGLGVAMTEVRHEIASVASADAYMRVSGRLAIATTTYGAGFTNTMTALAEAAQARTPLLLVVGDAPSTGPRPWDIDQEMAAAALGVRTFTIRPDNVGPMVDRAVESAWRHRKPVVLAIPYDLVNAEVVPAARRESVDLDDPATREELAAATMPAPAGQDPDVAAGQPTTRVTLAELNQAVQTLAAAERPVVLAGRGAWLAGAGQQLDAIAARLGALTASTALARGMFSEDAYDLGITGGFGQEAAMAQIASADVVLVVGASLNQFTMRFGELFGADARVVRIDLDPVEAPRSVHRIEHQLLRGDASEVLDALLTGLEAARPEPGNWRELVAGLEADGELRRRDTGADSADGLCADGLLDPRAVASRLAELLPEDRYVTSDGGHFIGWANMFWPVSSPNRMIMVGTAYQTIGTGFSTVAGVAAAAPESTVVLTTGDGGGLMSIADLETTVRTARSCVIVVWNDGAYGAEVHLYGLMGLDKQPMLIPGVDFAALADAVGAKGVRVSRLEHLDALREWRTAGATGTILLDCRVSRSVVAPYQREIQRVNGLEV